MSRVTRAVSLEIAILRRTLKAMDRSLRRLAPNLRAALNKTANARPARAKRKLNLSAKRLAQLKVQGRYMVSIRQLRPKHKAEVRAVLQKKGMQAAITRAERIIRTEKAA